MMADKNNFEVANEDTVQCLIFPTSTNADSLQLLCESINKTIQSLSDGYIWHRDEFRVHVPIFYPEKHDMPVHLVSTTCFGDNIEDEWFIVFLILEITKQYKDLVVQLYDNDGEFMLIESADLLPTWANPDSTENRVFIYQNRIHVIPPTIIDLDTDIKLSAAVKLVISRPEQTASPEIYKAIVPRISGYPEKITENIHTAIVKLPINIAALLTLKPSLISPITSAYCNHDVLDAKVFKNVKYEDCITSPVKFTKCLYAMLIHSKLTESVKHLRTNKQDKKCDLGVKLSCGYEIIMNKLSEDLFSSKEFNRFIKSLSDHGYFKDNLEGSKDYKQLLQKAKEFFINMESTVNLQVCNNIMQVMNTEEFIYLKEKLLNEQNSEDILIEDNDDWLNINSEQLNDLLNSRYGKPFKFKNSDGMDSQKLTSELSNFMKQTSDFEGIETKKERDSEDEDIEFDSEEFINTLKNMMNIVSNNIADIDSDDDDFTEITDEDDLEDEDFARELKAKLQTDETQINQPALHNMIQSIKEEEGASGPSSNIFRTIGINKIDLLNVEQ